MNTIYMIVRNTWREDYDSRGYWDESIDPDYGFYTDKAKAEAKTEELTRPGRERFEAQMQKYEEAVIAEREKREAAKALGFNHQGHSLPFRPDPPDFYTLEEIEAAE